jgi:hypothetical protein
MRQKKTEWKKYCDRCGKLYIATSRSSQYCEDCNLHNQRHRKEVVEWVKQIKGGRQE